MTDIPTREIFWQISGRGIFYLLSMAALAVLSWGLFQGVRFVRRGPASSTGPVRTLGTRAVIADILSHRPLAGENNARWWHLLIFFGFVLLFLVTCYVMLAHYGREALFTGVPYLLVTLTADLAGAAVILGALLALFTMRRDDSPARDRSRGKAAALSLLAAVCVTGFLVEGLRIHLTGDPWRGWSPVGAVVSSMLPSLAGSEGPRLFKGLWWLHSILALGLLAWLPLSARFRHMFFLPFHRAAVPLEPKSPAPVPDLGSLRTARPSPGSVRLGVETPADTTRRQRLGLLACMDCGRCERLCPAFLTGQSLTPRRYLQDLREYVMRSGEEGRGGREKNASAGEAITVSALWACRLCRACEELCPAGIGHVSQIIEIRRAEVLGHGRLPDDGAAALRNLARTGDPYGAGPSERAAWIRDQRLSCLPKRDPGKPLLLWTGCFQPGDEQKPRVLSCLSALLKQFEIPFFIHEGTSCCGDPARILGDEDLFQALATQQIKEIEDSGAEEVLVHCPHCYTVLKDVYPLLGARFSVVHTSELFRDRTEEKGLVGRGGFPNPLSVVYHDPCFLSRYQDLADSPRSILEALAGLELREAPRGGRKGYCCGAGGGHFFMDLDLQERPSSQRLEELLGQGPQVLAVSCGFCFSMFDDALRRLPDPPAVRIADWLELLKEAAER